MSSIPAGPRRKSSFRFSGGRGLRSEGTYRWFLRSVGALFLVLLLALVVVIAVQGWPAWSHFGWAFLVRRTWDPVHAVYGALPLIVGTVETSVIALVLALPVGLGTAIFLAEFAPRWARTPITILVELLAAVPSVVFGLWGLLAVAPWVSSGLEPVLQRVTHGFPLFSGPPLGVGLLLASLVLAAMIIPTISAISRDVLVAVATEQREAAMALGSTHWQMVRRAVLPVATNGILGAVTLALGRALGETMAVTMVIGNRVAVALSLFAPSNTIASAIANQFTEATEPFHKSSLLLLAAILMVISLIVNIVARLLVWSVGQQQVRAVV